MPRPAVIQLTSPARMVWLGAQTVAVHDLAVEQIGDGGEADMGVRAYVHLARDAGRQFHRPEMIEEDEGPTM